MRRANIHYRELPVAGRRPADALYNDPQIIAENAAWRLAWEQPELSAHSGITRMQKRVICAAVMLAVCCVAIMPQSTVLSLAWLLAAFFTTVIIFRISLLFSGLYEHFHAGDAQRNAAELCDSELPVYTVLTPLYREPGSVAQIVNALTRLNYPPARLDIKLILEIDDPETMAAVQRLTLPPHFEILQVPVQAPRTKPKACNFALHSARGAYVVIYDAEDIPDPDQLRKAASVFHKNGERLACLQARLNYYNPLENWLTRQFTLEYSMWFDWLLPGLQALGLPIPLGGTSNHFRTGILRAIGGWDSYNVTEDADLGLRLARRNYACAVLNSTTLEEANCQHANWVRQRTRWQKGYMLTWLVHMRSPFRLWQQLGAKGFFGFQLFVGGTVALALALPAALLIFLLALCACGPAVSALLLQLNAAIFVAGIIVHALSAAIGAMGRKQYRLLPEILLTPFYWGLTMLASLRAIGQLVQRPFDWEKTRHSISKIAPVTLCAQAPPRTNAYPVAITRSTAAAP